MAHSFYEYNHGHIAVKALPQIVEVEPTNICQLSCLFCSRDAIEAQVGGFGSMPLSSFMELVDADHKQLYNPRLFLRGESLLHPKIVDMVSYLKTYRGDNVRTIGLTTNGLLLDAIMFQELVDAGLDHVEISFEGVSKEVYEQVRVGSNFEQVKQNILDCCEMKVKNNWKVNIGISIINCQQTTSHLQSFIHEWSQVKGISRVDVGTLEDWTGTLDVSSMKLAGTRRCSNICPAPWFVVSVLWDGSVLPCCKWMTEPMGNIFESSLEEIWNSSEYCKLRRLMLQGREAHPYCRTCHSDVFQPSSAYMMEQSSAFPFTFGAAKALWQFLGYSSQREYQPMRKSEKDDL